MSEKTKGEQLREELLMNPKNLTETMSEEELKAAYDFARATRPSWMPPRLSARLLPLP